MLAKVVKGLLLLMVASLAFILGINNFRSTDISITKTVQAYKQGVDWLVANDSEKKGPQSHAMVDAA